MNEVFKTSDQGLAAYLIVKGFQCIKAVPAGERDPRRKAFVFIDVPNADQLQKDYDNYVPDLISPKEFAQRWRTTTRIAKEGLTDEEMEKLRRG